MKKFQFNNKILRERRRDLRKSQTTAEEKLWECLRDHQLSGLKFYRQYSVGPYILDFYCPKLKLAIELDGKSHNKSDAKIYDIERTRYLKNINVNVMRFKNLEVTENTAEVLTKIQAFFP